MRAGSGVRRGAGRAAAALAAAGAIVLCAAAGWMPNPKLWDRGWTGYGRTAQHDAQTTAATQPLERILWQTPVDLQPQYSGTVLYIHYGTPLITMNNIVVVTVKTGATDGFRIEGRRARDGELVWTEETDYSLPPQSWTPACGSALTPQLRLVTPAAGGTVLVRRNPEVAGSAVERVAFFGNAAYAADPEAYNANVKIHTPITSDASGNVFFGFIVSGATPAGLSSGIARITPAGVGSWVSAPDAAGDPSIERVPYNCAPAVSRDGGIVYIGARDAGGAGYLLGLNSATLARVWSARLRDPVTGLDGYMFDEATSSPAVGPDGDVYYGVFENPIGYNHLRGWMLHFDGTLAQVKLPGAFGWDDTASIVPVSMVPDYDGPSRYLVMTKYNNYGEGGGDGVNKVAVLDPGAPAPDPISGGTAMAVVRQIAGPTPDPDHGPWAVREWCINTAAVDVPGRSVMVNSEDGSLYRWDLAGNTLSQAVVLTPGIGEAYTPTVIGPDGTVYAINNATLFAVGRNP